MQTFPALGGCGNGGNNNGVLIHTAHTGIVTKRKKEATLYATLRSPYLLERASHARFRGCNQKSIGNKNICAPIQTRLTFCCIVL